MPGDVTTDAGKTEPPSPATLAALAAMEARLLILLPGGNGASAGLIDRIMAADGERPAVRVNRLLFIGTCICAGGAGRISDEEFLRLAQTRRADTLSATPEGRMIERHMRLLGRLVWAGCRKRGELQ